ncbi:Alcohol dehydrogenase GroES-like domain protein [Aspergillus parasiticus SU-1]|uniref:D-xylulose reductase n=1 Tax=Aspergillus parasiticus (strain ATCC 56775 / NRRL 5862 / SRRC 143 / SU-1) TaxID=1403190 RepID=A0A0F0I4B1_ASPPU|nr:Alcohol dehydrogenase GroES-like domain protein [Aspergillus parasiticus SU-1]
MSESARNPSCLLYGPLDARFEDRPMPVLDNPHDVIVQIAYTGVCGSDVHFWLHGGIRTYVSETQPLTNGSRSIRVAIEPGYPCRRCARCKIGRYNLCPEMKFAADPPLTHDTLTKYFKVPADFCYKIPDNMSLSDAVLMEPLAVAIHAVRLADVKLGNRVIVFGAGTVGLFCAAVAREFGASIVVSVDVLENRLRFAGEFIGSVGRTAMPDLSLSPEENAQRLIQTQELGEGAKIVIDASGAEASVQTGVFSLRMGGTYVQAGMGKRKIEFPISEMCEREIVAKGCFRYGAGDFDLGIHLVSSGRIQLAGLVTKIFPFESATEAWETAKRGEGTKTLIEGPKSWKGCIRASVGVGMASAARG